MAGARYRTAGPFAAVARPRATGADAFGARPGAHGALPAGAQPLTAHERPARGVGGPNETASEPTFGDRLAKSLKNDGDPVEKRGKPWKNLCESI